MPKQSCHSRHGPPVVWLELFYPDYWIPAQARTVFSSSSQQQTRCDVLPSMQLVSQAPADHWRVLGLLFNHEDGGCISLSLLLIRISEATRSETSTESESEDRESDPPCRKRGFSGPPLPIKSINKQSHRNFLSILKKPAHLTSNSSPARTSETLDQGPKTSRPNHLTADWDYNQSDPAESKQIQKWTHTYPSVRVHQSDFLVQFSKDGSVCLPERMDGALPIQNTLLWINITLHHFSAFSSDKSKNKLILNLRFNHWRSSSGWLKM